MARKLDAFTITAKLTLLADVTIKAESYEDAIARSKDLRESDFVSFKGEFIDGKMEVVNIARDHYWDLER
jgi:hypothetical protein